MKKYVLSSVLFIVGFIAAYIGLCYLVPGLRIKLFAEPLEYFKESIKHMAIYKTVISLIIGLIAGGIPWIGIGNKDEI